MSTPSWIPSIVRENISLKPYTTLKVGGTARYFAGVSTLEDLREVLAFRKTVNYPLFILGKGSNLLLGDGQLEAIFVQNKLNALSFDNEKVCVGAGVNVSYLSQKVSKMGYGGLEFFSGIPGTVGGCIAMNAGASKADTASRLLIVKTIDYDGVEHTYEAKTLEFGYRTSPFRSKNEVIYEAVFSVFKDSEAENKRQTILKNRLDAQPYTVPTAGCMFKNPEGNSAGRLIDSLGLKGSKIGGVQVSMKHANFFENTGTATTRDILELMQHIRYEVKKQTGIELELEVLPCFTTYTRTPQHPMGN